MDFFASLIKTIATEGVIYDSPELVENLQVWISSMSSAGSRPFRHTATVVSLGIVGALAEIARTHIEARATALRQAESEQRKSRGGNKERVKTFNAEADKAHGRSEEVQNLIRDWFDTVFVHRYRDVDARIRCDCVSALGTWVGTLPDLFLNSSHLRYFGWCLSDTASATRKEVVRCLKPLYEDDDNIGGLRAFTERFRPRMVEMAIRDAEPEIRATTVQLLGVVRAKELLEPDDVDTIGKLIYDSDPKVREAVAPFLAASVEDMYQLKYDELGDPETVQEQVSSDADDFESPRLEWLRLKALAELMTSYDDDDEASHIAKGHLGSADVLVAAGLESRFTLAAQALRSELDPLFRAWEVLAGYLLFDHSSTTGSGANETIVRLQEEAKLSEKEEVMLLDVLNVSVGICLTGVLDQGPTSKKARKTKAELRELEETRDTAAQRLALLIPRLLGKFAAEPESASAVLRLERVLNLEVFQELRQDSTAFSSLLDNVKKQFLEHENQFVIAEASAALAHANSYEELEEITSGKMQALWDDTCYNLVALANGEEVSSRASMSYAVTLSISNTLLRISNLASISDCIEAFHTKRTYKPSKNRRTSKKVESTPTAPLDLILKMVNRGVSASQTDDPETEKVEDTLMLQDYKCIMFYFLWQARALGESEPVEREGVYELTDRRNAVITALTRTIKHRRSVDDVRLGAANLLLDLHIAYAQFRAPSSDEDMSHTAELAQRIPDRTVDYLLATFLAAERDFARKASKKVDTQPEDDEDPIDDEPEDPDVEADATDNPELSRKKQRDALMTEQRFCFFASKLVLAIASGSVDTDTPSGGKLRARLLKNVRSLGQNFKEVCAALTTPREKKTKAVPKKPSGRTKAAAAAAAAEKSTEMVEDSDEEDEAAGDEAAEEERREAEEREEQETREGAMELDGSEAEADSVVGD